MAQSRETASPPWLEEMAHLVLDEGTEADPGWLSRSWLITSDIGLRVQGQPLDDGMADFVGLLIDEIERLRGMLEFCLGQLRMHSPKMNGQHSYRFCGGWPMTHAIGPTPEDAIRAAMAEVTRSRQEA